MDLGKLGSAGRATAENEAERLLKAGADADLSLISLLQGQQQK